MSILYLTLLIIFWIFTVLILAFKPSLSDISAFELKRLADKGDLNAKKELLRLKNQSAIKMLSLVKLLVVQSFVVCWAILYFGWLLGVIVAIAMIFVAVLVSSLRIVGALIGKIYKITEDRLLAIIDKWPIFNKIAGDSSVESHNVHIKSRDELLWLIAKAKGILTADERQLIDNSLNFDNRSLKSVMTLRADIKTVDRSEFLGPLVLDELHKTGHSHFPVINGDVDHIIGILNISSLLSLDNKKSTTAERVMEQKVYYIREDKSLKQALSVFLRTQHRLLIVVDEAKNTVGAVVLKDVIEALVGRQ